jgi:septum formation topological specificity factor MinE
MYVEQVRDDIIKGLSKDVKILDDLLKISHCSEKSELLYTSFCMLSLLCLLLTIF